MWIPLGDHCLSAILLRDAGKRTCAFPWDWICSHEWQQRDFFPRMCGFLYQLLEDIPISQFIDAFLDAFSFPHDTDLDRNALRAKYTRRFQRLYDAIVSHEPHTYIFATRFESISSDALCSLVQRLRQYAPQSRFVWISGIEVDRQLAFEEHIDVIVVPYPESQYYDWDYTVFRPAIQASWSQQDWFSVSPMPTDTFDSSCRNPDGSTGLCGIHCRPCSGFES